MPTLPPAPVVTLALLSWIWTQTKSYYSRGEDKCCLNCRGTEMGGASGGCLTVHALPAKLQKKFAIEGVGEAARVCGGAQPVCTRAQLDYRPSR